MVWSPGPGWESFSLSSVDACLRPSFPRPVLESVPAGQGGVAGEGHRELSVCVNWPRMPWLWPLLLDTHHLLEMALNYSNLDLSKIATLKWRLEKRRLDFFPSEILNARKIELFELMNCLKQWGVSPFVLALQN